MFKNGFIFLVTICLSYQMIGQTAESKHILLAWDASFSETNRVVESDFKFLDNYFDRNKEAVVDLLVFSNALVVNKEFVISNGKWEELRSSLQKTEYDGATNFKVIESMVSLNHEELLLFTDGAQSIGIDVPTFGIKTFVINSSPYRDQMDLNAILVKNKARLFDYGRAIFSNQQEKEGVSTSVRPDEKSNTQDEPFTNRVRLNEVIVSEKQSEETPSETINLGNGEVDKNRVGVAVQTIGDEQISPITTDVSNVLQGKFSGVQIGNRAGDRGTEADISKITMRTNNSMILNNYGLIVIDGVPQQQGDSSKNAKLNSSPQPGFGFVDPENIADITVLKGMAATTRYGTLGANGVILITTKSSKGAKPKDGKPVDRALLKNNIYNGDLSISEKSDEPIYTSELSKIADKNDAYDFYLKQRSNFLDSPDYFIAMYEYFKSRDKDKAQRILSNLAEINTKNIALLRILAFKYEEEGDLTNALKINQQILDLDDNSAQSKLDLALVYDASKKYASAYKLLSELVNNNLEGTTDMSAMKKTAVNSLRNVIKEAGSSITVNEEDKKYQNQVRYDARILVMWNKSNAEFELQIINPDKRFFTWEHSQVSNLGTFQKGIKNDVNTEEFHLIDAQKGNWFIKANDVSENAMTEPVFLKVIVYYNFGLPSQRKEITTMRLYSDGINETLFKIGL